MQRLNSKTLSFALLSVVVLLSLVMALSAAVRIGGSAFSANGQLARDHQYVGGCPVELKFDWGVVGSDPSRLVYRTIRSDGAQGPTRSVQHPGGNRSMPVIEHWRLGAPTPQFRNYRGWVELIVESPNPASMRIPFTIHCQ
ncbi:MAG TPA: hypothetical protein VMH28_02550 [Candidatus Acidoferrales bacterium]|nr:hypothetical protein [Candidatus Acidoferrales bacterium]